MDTLALKIVLTPALIGSVSLAGRRWGPAVSGSLVGLPLTSAPVALFLALDHGDAFGAATARGTLAGVISVAVFCLAYAYLAFRTAWPLATLGGWLVFAGSTWLLQSVTPPLPVEFAGVVIVLALVLLLLPRRWSKSSLAASPWWDIPARVVVATGFVVALTALASTLGPRLSGLLATIPLFTTVLAAFTQSLQGPTQATRLLRGTVLGLFGTAAFFLVVAALIEPAGLLVTFLLATVVALALQIASLRVVNRGQVTA